MTTEPLTITASVLCDCPGRPVGHVWNPTPGWCPNPQQVNDA